MSELCLCNSQRPFANCCGPYLSDWAKKRAPTAEALMRSRYSAFCQSNIDYLLATHHPSARQPNERANLARSIKRTRWVNLLIVSTQKGRSTDLTGTVEFVAAYRAAAHQPVALLANPSLPNSSSPADDLAQLHERSRFIQENNQWFYTAGDILPAYRPKRSEPCWCGSGQKFKHCHSSSS
jgi:SEC-C motif domain protein